MTRNVGLISRRTALAAAVIAGASFLGGFSAAAQQVATPFTAKQCSDAISIANSIVEANKGRISRELVDSFVKFGKSNCDLGTDWNLTNKTDEAIFGEFRVRLIALRTADATAPAVLAKK